MKRRHIPTIFQLPYLPIWLAPVILLAPIILSGQALFWGTPFLQFVPWRDAAWELLRSGHLPLWNPWAGNGAPLLANYQSALLYPPNWILLALQAAGGTGAQAWGQAVVVCLHLIWAGLGMAYLTRELGVGKVGQAVAGLAFGMSSYLVARSGFLSINAAVAWTPWVLLATNRIAGPRLENRVQPGHRVGRESIFLGLVSGMQLLAGHAQTTWYTFVLTGAWLLVWGFRQPGWGARWIALRTFALGILIGAGLAAIQLVPTAEYLLQSQRASAVDYDFAMTYSFWPWHFLTLIAPDFFGSPVRGDYWFNAWFWEDAIYVGLLPLLVGLLGAIGTIFRRKRADAKDIGEDRKAFTVFLLGVIGMSFLLALGRYTPVFPFLYRAVPTFNMFQAPARIALWAVSGLALLGGMGVDRWQPPAGRALYWTRLSVAGAVAIMIGAGAAWYGLRDLHATFVRAFTLTGIWAAGTGALSLLRPKGELETRSWWSWGVAALVAVDLLVATWGLQPGISSRYYSEPAKTANQVTQMLDGRRLYIGKQAEYDLKYNHYLQTNSFEPGRDWESYKSLLLADANLSEGIPSSNNFDPLVPGNYAFWMNRLDAMDPTEQEPLIKMMNVGAVERLDPNARDGVRFDSLEGGTRFRWYPCAEATNSLEEAWSGVVRNNSGNHDQKISPAVVILGNAPPETTDCSRNGVAQILVISENPDQIILKVTADRAGWLFQSDTWYPGWTAQVDGNPASIYPANVAFRAIRVPAGEHEIKISYQPRSFFLGVGLTFLTGFCLIGWSVYRSRRSDQVIEGRMDKE
jgi:hypothetical protein